MDSGAAQGAPGPTGARQKRWRCALFDLVPLTRRLVKKQQLQMAIYLAPSPGAETPTSPEWERFPLPGRDWARISLLAFKGNAE